MKRTISVKIDDHGIYHDGKIWEPKPDVIESKNIQKKQNRIKIGKTFKSFIKSVMHDRISDISHIFDSISYGMKLSNINIPKAFCKNTEKSNKVKSGSKSNSGSDSKEVIQKRAFSSEEKEIFMPGFGSEHFYRVIYSDMQTRKTPIMAASSLFIVLNLRMPVFIFVQNRNADLVQLRQRLDDFFLSWKGYTDSLSIQEHLKAEMIVLEPERGKLTTQETIRTAMQGGIAKIFVSLFSATDIDPIVEMVEANELKRYAIILDEADHLDNGSEKSSVSKSFENFCKNAAFVQNVTATPLTTLSHRVCLRRHFFMLPPPPYYKGLAQVNWKDLPLKSEPCNSVDDDPFTTDANLIPFLSRYHKKFIPRVSVNAEKVPRYLLIRMAKTIEPQLKAAAFTYTNYPYTVTITWNGGGHGTTMRSKLLPTSSISLPDSRIKSEYKDGVHYFNNVHIGKLITYLHMNRKKENGDLKFERIIVYAGVMADRGITFGADNYSYCKEKNIAWWHLTDMYYIGNKDRSIQNLANILQTCGRICGVYNDNISLSLYSNWVDGIREAYTLQRELLDRVNKIGSPDDNILENLKSMNVSKKKKVKKIRITNNYVNEPVKWINASDVQFGGWTEEKRNGLLEGRREEEQLGQQERSKLSENLIYTINPDTLTDSKARIVSDVIDQIGSANKWLSRANIINNLVKKKGYIVNSIRADLTRLQQSVVGKKTIGYGLNFRKITGKDEIEILYRT